MGKFEDFRLFVVGTNRDTEIGILLDRFSGYCRRCILLVRRLGADILPGGGSFAQAGALLVHFDRARDSFIALHTIRGRSLYIGSFIDKAISVYNIREAKVTIQLCGA